MDEIDERILELLKGNARITYQELGDSLGMSRVAAKKRVRKLEEAGIIRGYNTTIYKEGDITVLIDIRTQSGKYEKVLEYVATRTAFIRQILGNEKKEYIHIVAVSDSVEDLKYLERMILKKCGKDIDSMTCHVVTEIVKDVYGGVTYETRRKAIQTDQEDN